MKIYLLMTLFGILFDRDSFHFDAETRLEAGFSISLKASLASQLKASPSATARCRPE